ncbi:DUF4920 domain-containing protein [Sinomicrobium weinanense]|uniref:DUF4920 domain-containing protein n=1 Tax=Sinomicrobium weinanense TaxID=2842200 RepID=A0A926JS42_9FLAO|nr:DUF4920 domain-containing protein [Sinomicrobium weinanense]MBC9796206.1 DUF4920 domain-containing protein [Sinomicrobium weinanense]MBU3123485.1 DUF4920 domain-containing protein [Sinomicrobium weinanense]
MKLLIAKFSTILSVMVLSGCKQEVKKPVENEAYASFGDSITLSGKWETRDMDNRFAQLEKGDTIPVKFTSRIIEVCPKKGCWMKVELTDGRQAMVRFKDYGFFVPTDASGEVVMEGKAYVEKMPVKDLKHYAEDAGKSEEEIAQITEPEITYAVEAHGVLIKQ